MNKWQASCISVLLLAPLSVRAATLYVDRVMGNDATTYEDNSSSTPWATIGRAAWGSASRGAPVPGQAARAGDTVIVRAGTYSTVGTNSRYDPAYNPVNNGTSGNPIIFRAEGRVTLALSSSSGPVAGCLSRSHVVWDGFYIDEANAASRPDTGPVVVWGSSNCTIQNFEIRSVVSTWQDNHNGIRVEASNNTLIRNNLIYGLQGGQNDAAVMLYDSNDSIIENNEFSDVGTGVYVKGQHPGFTQRRTIIRFNVIQRARHAGLIIGPAARDGRTYQNLVRDSVNSAPAIKLYTVGSGEGGEPINEIIANNTLDGNGYGQLFVGAGQNNIFANNIVTNSGRAAVWSWINNNPGGLAFEHNVYWSFSNFAELSDGNRTFANWKSSFSKDLAVPASLNADPMFVDPRAGNFKLQVGSPARAVGLDVLDLNRNGSFSDLIAAGAYITGTEIIGRTSGVGMGPPPSPPYALSAN